MVERHGGALPADLGALLALPGIGPYTARAILVFAFEADVGLVDTNAGRMLARAGAGRPLARAEAQGVADTLVPAGRGWAWGQAVFDLGALVCTRRAPACGECPIAAHCTWARAGWPEPDPVVGSAGISGGQSRFAGSDRQGRGRLVAALRAGPIAPADIASAAGWPDDPARAGRVAATLVRDGLAVRRSDGARSRYPVRARRISSTASSASAAISSSVRSWIGCGTNTRAGSAPSAADWAIAASTNSDEATKTDGMPRPSRSTMSCTLHDVHDPQSARASITTSHCCRDLVPEIDRRRLRERRLRVTQDTHPALGEALLDPVEEDVAPRL